MASRVPWPGWAAFLLPALVLLVVPADWPRWAYMWLTVSAIYLAFKILTLTAAPTESVPASRKWAYVFAWLGLNAPAFLATNPSRRPAPPAPSEWLEGLLNATAGAVVFWNAHRWIGPSAPVVLGWAGMIGTILMLHFGTFHLVSCAWRRGGVDAQPLMNHPTRSTGVADFWGRRWNTAFRDVTHQFLFRPLAARVGATAALVIGFVFSGLLHELVISVPAGGGYGGPTAFFCIQAAALVVERSAAGRSIGLARGWRGRLFSALVLLLPARLLFHDPFVLRIVVPFMQALGAA
ncbi:MAG: membrane bound O-acyl transferase family-domain-containing protein [Pirellulales bacterium]